MLLREAIRLSRVRMQQGRGGPFGAVVARDGRLIARGWNMVTSALDPTAHAEVVAIRRACRAARAFELRGCVLYTSCEPCPMCLAAAYWARLDRLVFAATRQDAAGAGFDDAFIYDEVPLAAEARSLPTRQLLRAEAAVVFGEWLAKDDRIHLLACSGPVRRGWRRSEQVRESVVHVGFEAAMKRTRISLAVVCRIDRRRLRGRARRFRGPRPDRDAGCGRPHDAF